MTGGPTLLWLAAAAFGSPVTDWAAKLNAGSFEGDAQAYHPLAASFLAAGTAAEARPDAVRVESIGETVRGRPIWAFEVHDPAVPVTRKVLVFAGIHSMEWISVETAFQLLDDLIAVPPRGVAVTVVPVLNVDGRIRSEGDIRAGRDVYRRPNAHGVDLNRDFAVHHEGSGVWRHVLPGYYTSSPAPLSQPESRAIDRLADRERFDRAASLHAFGGYLYVPWAGRWPRAPDYREMLRLGRTMEAAQGPHAYRTKQLSRWGFFFRANGAEIDHLYGRYGTWSYLIELTRSGIDPLDAWRTGHIYFRWYNPPDPRPHIERGVAALRVLVTEPGGSPGPSLFAATRRRTPTTLETTGASVPVVAESPGSERSIPLAVPPYQSPP